MVEMPSYRARVNQLRDAARDRAASGARLVLAQAGLEAAAEDATERVSKIADEIALAGRANRELIETAIATRVERVAQRWGFARADQVAELKAEIADLRAEVQAATPTHPVGPDE